MKNVPFFPNPDTTHCYQSCLRMILKQFRPFEKYSWAELDRLTGKKPGLWTWSLLGLIEMEKMGFEVVDWEDFDYARFSVEGEPYLRERFGDEVADMQIKFSDLPYEMENAKKLLPFIGEPRSPKLADVAEHVSDGFLAICNVNLYSLNCQPGYSGHFVLVYEIDDEFVYMHDPGPPAAPSRKVAIADFEKAWAVTSERDRNMMAFRPKR